MRNSIIASAIACVALAACGGGSTGSVPQAGSVSNNAGGSSGSSTSSAGKATVTITFAVPAKGSAQSASRNTAASTGRTPQWISSNTTEVTATFSPSGQGSPASGTAACTSNCTLSVNVAPGTYNVVVTAGDSNGPLSAGTATGFTVTLGQANTLTLSGPLTEVLRTVQLTPVLPTALYNGQVSTPAVTANLLDSDGAALSQPGPWVDQYGVAVTGIAVTPNSPSGTLTLSGGTAAVPITSASQALSVSFSGTENLNPSTVSLNASVSTGSVNAQTLSSTVYSPFHVAQTTPAAYNPSTGANTGNPLINIADPIGEADIEYPLLISQAQTLTVTDFDTSPNFPIYVDPSGCANGDDDIYYSPPFDAAGNDWDGSNPIQILSYSGPFTMTFTIWPTNPNSCTFDIYDSAGNYYYVNLYYDQSQLYVSGKKRGRAR